MINLLEIKAANLAASAEYDAEAAKWQQHADESGDSEDADKASFYRSLAAEKRAAAAWVDFDLTAGVE
jgi:hypothetical protein